MKQKALFKDYEPDDWRDEWRDMPEYVQKRNVFHVIKISFGTKKDMEAFSELIGKNITLKTKTIHIPPIPKESSKGKLYIDES